MTGAGMMADTYLVTGGAGFIGSNFIHYLFNKYPDCRVINLDKLTYAGNPENLADIQDNPRYEFVRGDICDRAIVDQVMDSKVDFVFNFAAETHVDRSIIDPMGFISTDVMGAFVLLESALKHKNIKRFIQISTDEVYGSRETGSFTEKDPLNPSSPYSASKAGGELIARAFFTTHGLPVIVTRASNNYGPYQYPEKLIPLFVTNALEDKPLPLYGDGMNVRDWLYVEDHCEALDIVNRKGVPGEIYNIGGDNERTNVEITHRILEILDKPATLIHKVKDRPGHDRRYSIDSAKTRALGWRPRHDFDRGMIETVHWYRDHPDWWHNLKTKKKEFSEYYDKWYNQQMGLKK